jgi:LPXTG-site transpeptidase (sortase) family protein
MEAPATDAASGWYKNGPNPGNPGSAVIAGHLGVNSRAVFSDLGSLVKGDKVLVTDSSNQTATFAVTHIRRYKNNANPSEVFTSTSGSHLNLITCEGEWEPSQATYSGRLVVFTDRVE